MIKDSNAPAAKVSRKDASLRATKSGLHEAQRRSLARLVFVVTGLLLTPYGAFQLIGGHLFVATLELLLGTGMALGGYWLGRSRSLQRWIYLYLITIFCFSVYILVMPSRSETGFVWIFMMPVLSYLLLGRVAGFLLAAPFMVAGLVAYSRQLGEIQTASEMIDLLNPIICSLALLGFIHFYELRRSQAQSKLVTLAETDALTGLANRSNFQATLDRTISESRRSETTFALVLIDLDHFKRINDSLGHDAGDRVLKHVSDCLSLRLRTTDSLGRLGGEEFGLLLRDVKPGGAYPIVNELRERLQESEMVYGDSTIALTASFGIAYWPTGALLSNELYQVADRRLYASKHAGRNTVTEQDPDSDVRDNGKVSDIAGTAT
jgi:diguanylate cyclase (GGDEF)-like protein